MQQYRPHIVGILIPRGAPDIDIRECSPFCLQISFPTRSRRARRAGVASRPRARARAAPSRSIWRCRAAAPTAPLPGGCSISCSTTAGSGSKAFPARRRERSTRSCSPTGSPAAARTRRANASPISGARSPMLSPYDLNPLNINPLKELIERFVDFEAIRRDRGLELFISATNVQTGELRVFTRAEITPEVVMASAALPLLFRAVEIDGVPYWDGGYSGNPVVVPFLRATATEDALIVQINPRERRKVPTRPREIMSRVNEINFNASLLSELRGVAFVNRLIDEGRLPRGMRPGEFRRLKLHRIVMEDLGEAFGARSTLKTDYEYFETLRKLGQRATRRFLDAHFDDIGRRSTIDFPAKVEPELVKERQ